MKVMRVVRIGVCVGLAAAVPSAALAQSDDLAGPLSGPPVVGAPFSADAITTVQQILGDGTRIDRRGTARYYRDRAGRVRVEQVILGLEALNPNLAASSQVRITVFPDPTQRTVYTLDPESRTAIQGPRDLAGQSIGGGDTFSVPLGWARFLVFHRSERLQQRYGFDGNAVSEMPLGTRRIAGIDAVGKRITITIPVGLLGNDRPMEIVDERWESPELKLTIYSRTSDPRAGIVEYRLTNVKRTEPAADLFVLPADYTLGTSPKDDGWIRLYFAEPPKGAVGPRRK